MFEGVLNSTTSMINSTPEHYISLITLVFFTLVILIYSVFVFYFYKFIASKNILSLDLNKYNQSANASAMKFFAVLLYILEYLIIFPLLTVFWFMFFSVFLLVLAKNLNVSMILTISAALIASIRITAYINSELARDLAKMLPFTLLALSLTQPDFFSIVLFLERIQSVPSLIYNIPYFISFIVIIEFIMRIGNLTSRTVFSDNTVQS